MPGAGASVTGLKGIVFARLAPSVRAISGKTGANSPILEKAGKCTKVK